MPFSIIGDKNKFKVHVNGKPIGVEDRDYFRQLQYLWSIGNVGDEFRAQATNAEHYANLSGMVTSDDGATFEVSGWVGTFDEQKSLNVEEGDNTVVVHAWGKLLHEDLLADVKAGGIYTKYLIGEIRADFVDADEEPDIATTDRQHLKEDDPRFRLLLEWFRSEVLHKIEPAWSEWRNEGSLERALAIDAIKDWYQGLSRDNRKFAKQLFGKIGKLALPDEDVRRELYRNTILAFEKLKLRESLTSIESLPDNADFALVEAVFTGIDEIEAVEYHQISKSRLAVIRAFANLVDANEKERIVQHYIFDHIWLLHPSWERASTNKRIEEAVKKEFGKIRLTDEEKRGRIDIRYRSAAGKHIVIELKRAGVSVNVYDLAKQLQKYRSAMEKCLRAKFPDEPRVIELIAVLGSAPTGAPADRVREILQTSNGRYVTYDALIKEGLESYEAYLEADERVSRLQDVLDRV